jgi:hypothetical protein
VGTAGVAVGEAFGSAVPEVGTCDNDEGVAAAAVDLAMAPFADGLGATLHAVKPPINNAATAAEPTRRIEMVRLSLSIVAPFAQRLAQSNVGRLYRTTRLLRGQSDLLSRASRRYQAPTAAFAASVAQMGSWERLQLPESGT